MTLTQKLKYHLKSVAPRFMLLWYNRLISRLIIQKKYGSHFQIDWKKTAPTAPDRIWTQVYDDSWEDWEGQDLAPQDIELIKNQIQPQDRILDAGCGDGYLLAGLEDRINCPVGIDLSLAALNKARKRLGSKALLTQAFLEALPFADNSFDVVICVHTLEHVRDLSQAVNELARAARRKLVILVPVQEYKPYTEDYHIHFFRDEADLLNRIALPHAKCIRCRNPPGEYKYQGDLLFLTVDLQ
ncbi:MAG: class I SAM-dependent methyltransferase [Calditrichota bacterium]